VISINRNGIVFLGSTPIHPSQLVERLTPVLEARRDKSVFLKGDRDVPYGTVIEVLDTLRKGGIEDIGMITQPQAGSRRRGGR
jgi:biopolymer transport protein TolR